MSYVPSCDEIDTQYDGDDDEMAVMLFRTGSLQPTELEYLSLSLAPSMNYSGSVSLSEPSTATSSCLVGVAAAAALELAGFISHQVKPVSQTTDLLLKDMNKTTIDSVIANLRQLSYALEFTNMIPLPPPSIATDLIVQRVEKRERLRDLKFRNRLFISTIYFAHCATVNDGAL